MTQQQRGLIQKYDSFNDLIQKGDSFNVLIQKGDSLNVLFAESEIENIISELHKYLDESRPTIEILLTFLNPYLKYMIKPLLNNDYELVSRFIELQQQPLKNSCEYYHILFSLKKSIPQIEFSLDNLLNIPDEYFDTYFEYFFGENDHINTLIALDEIINCCLLRGYVKKIIIILKHNLEYPLIKIIYKFMMFNQVHLNDFLFWVKNECPQYVTVAYVNPFDSFFYRHIDYSILLSNFITNYYNHSEYYCAFNFDDHRCYFDNDDTLDKFLELRSYDFIVVREEKIVSDFLQYFPISSYEAVKNKFNIYFKHHLLTNLFSSQFDEIIKLYFINSLTTSKYFYKLIMYYEKYTDEYYMPRYLLNFSDYEINYSFSVSMINFICEHFPNELHDFTKALLRIMQKYTINQPFVFNHLIQLRKDNKIIIDLDYIFNVNIVKDLSAYEDFNVLFELISIFAHDIRIKDDTTNYLFLNRESDPKTGTILSEFLKYELI
jgi:hypothetical protein